MRIVSFDSKLRGESEFEVEKKSIFLGVERKKIENFWTRVSMKSLARIRGDKPLGQKPMFLGGVVFAF